MTALQERVQAGVVFLDKNYPNWRERVQPSLLWMGNYDQCILGQLAFGPYATYEELLAHYKLTREQCVEMGFDIELPNSGHRAEFKELDYQALTNAWLKI